MKNGRAIQHLALTAVALGLLFIVSCGDSGGGWQAGDDAQRSATGLVLASDAQISSGDDDQSQPATAYDLQHNQYLVVWTDARNFATSEYDIYGHFVNSSGQPVPYNFGVISNSNDFIINASAGDQMQPDVAYDFKKDMYLVVFTNTLDNTIYGQFLNSTAGLINGAFPIPRDYDHPLETQKWYVNGLTETEYKNELINTGDGITTSFSGTLPGAFADTTQIKNSVQADSTNFKIYDGTTHVATFHAADVDRPWLGNFVSIGNAIDAGTSTINMDTGEWELNFTIANEPAGPINANYKISKNTVNQSYETFYYESQTSPSVVYNRVKNRFEVAWVDTSNMEQQTGYVYPDRSICDYDYSNGRYDVLTDFTKAGDSVWYDAENSGSNLNFYYGGGDGDRRIVRYRSVTYDDMVDMIDNDLIYYNDEFSARSFYDPDGSPIDSKIYDASYFANTHWEKIDTTCTDTSATFDVKLNYDAYMGESSPDITYNPITGSPIVAWSSIQSSFVVLHTAELKYGEGWTVSGSSTGTVEDDKPLISMYTQDSPQVITLIPAGTYSGTSNVAPALGVDPYKARLLVAWENYDASEKNILGQMFDLQNFNIYGPMVIVSDAQYDQSAPKIDFDTVNQRYMVVWEDARNTATNLSNMDIFGQFVDPQGQLSGGNFPITVNKANQIAPSLAFGDFDSRNFLITWKDGRVLGNAEIFGQLWQYSHAPQLLITYDPAGGTDFTPLYDQNISFGGTYVGTPVSKKFRIENEGNAVLVISSFVNGPSVEFQDDGNHPFFSSTAKPESINPGSYHEMTVTFDPLQAETYTGEDAYINIISNGGSTTIYFSGTGLGDDPQILTTSLPDAAAGEIYNAVLLGASGTPPYTWSTVGNFPSSEFGLDVVNGTITNTVTVSTSGTYIFNAVLTDSLGKSITKSGLSITVARYAITTGSLPTAYFGQTYSQDINVVGDFSGVSSYNWSATGLPSGLGIFNSTDTVASVTGIVNSSVTEGTYPVTITFYDGANPAISKNYSLVVSNAVRFATAQTLKTATLDTYYSLMINTTNGEGPYTWTAPGIMPPGIDLAASCTGPNCYLQGTPTQPGTYYFTLTVDAANGTTDTELFILTVGDFQIMTESVKDAVITTDPDYQYLDTIVVDGGTGPYNWSLSSGSFPPGIGFGVDNTTAPVSSISGILVNTIKLYNTAAISGAGSYPFTVRVEDTSKSPALVAEQEYTINVSDLDIVTTLLVKNSDGSYTINGAAEGKEYLGPTLKAIGGSGGGYVWSEYKPDGISRMPGGLQINQLTGSLYGTIGSGTLGTYTFWIKVEDFDGNSAVKPFRITVSKLQITTEQDAIPVFSLGTYYTKDNSVRLDATSAVDWSITSFGQLAGVLDFDSTDPLNAGYLLGFIDPSLVSEGTYQITVRATDQSDPDIWAEKDFDIRITSMFLRDKSFSSITMDEENTSWILPMLFGTDYGGGSGVYTWNITGGNPPSGMSLNASTGDISGTPSAPGYYTWTLEVTDPSTEISISANYSVTINDPSVRGSSGSGSTFCFIATAAYGSHMDSEVKALRSFRDRYLMGSTLGKSVVSFYYRNSPPVADFIARHETLRTLTRAVIAPLAYAARFPMPIFGIVFFAGAVAVASRTRKKA